MKNLWFIVALLSMFIVNAFATSDTSGGSSGTTIIIDKSSYIEGEDVVASFKNMSGSGDDWIGVYKSGASNDWDNVVAWSWSGGTVNGSVVLKDIPVGKYQVRAFFKNSFETQATSSNFSVNEVGVVNDVTLITNLQSYKTNQKITVKFANMLGDSDDWIGIYPSGSKSNWDNIVDSKWTDSKKSGSLTFNSLPAGNYEARAFFKGTYNQEASKSFVVVSNNGGNNDSTVYEDANNGISSKWKTISGPFTPEAINGAIKLTTNWETNTHNSAEYQLPMNNSKQTILEVDVGGVGAAGGHVGGIHAWAPAGYMPHFGMGVIVETTNGIRGMTWDSFLNHEDVEAYKNDYGDGNIELIYPSPVEHVRGFGYTDINLWQHFKVDLNAYLNELEPGNKIIKVKTFYTKGGYLDNIKLSSK